MLFYRFEVLARNVLIMCARNFPRRFTYLKRYIVQVLYYTTA